MLIKQEKKNNENLPGIEQMARRSFVKRTNSTSNGAPRFLCNQ